MEVVLVELVVVGGGEKVRGPKPPFPERLVD